MSWGRGLHIKVIATLFCLCNSNFCAVVSNCGVFPSWLDNVLAWMWQSGYSLETWKGDQFHSKPSQVGTFHLSSIFRHSKWLSRTGKKITRSVCNKLTSFMSTLRQLNFFSQCMLKQNRKEVRTCKRFILFQKRFRPFKKSLPVWSCFWKHIHKQAFCDH